MPIFKQQDGFSLYYEDHGQGEPLILITGFSANHTAWDEILPDLACQYRVITLDNRGSGFSSAPKTPYTIEMMAGDVVALCNHLNIQSCHLLGSSMGGLIVQQLCAYSNLIIKSAIICNSGIDCRCSFKLYVDSLLSLMNTSADKKALAEANCSWIFSYQYLNSGSRLKSLVQQTLDSENQFSINGYLGQRAALELFSSQEWANTIKTRILVIGADEDLIFTASKSQALSKILPNAVYKEFTQCGHLPFIEYPSDFIDIISAFLNDDSQN